MQQQIYAFGDFRLDPRRRTVSRRGAPVHLTGKEFDTLWALVRQASSPVEKDALIREVWGEVNVAEENLRQHVRALRRKLGDDCIGTIPNRGYFMAIDVVCRSEPESHQPISVESAPLGSAAAAPETSQPPPDGRRRRLVPIVLCVVVLMAGAVGLFLSRTSHRQSRTIPQIGRILVRTTSEGRSAKTIPLPHKPAHLAISPDGQKLFVTGWSGRALTIVRTADQAVRVLELPRDAGPIAAGPDGRLFIGSSVDGLMILNIRTEELLPIVIPTGGQVHDLAVTPDGKKIFLAMAMGGLLRVSIGSWKVSQITDRVCPEYLEIDSQGRNLYVSYQCSGPTGRPGHDSVEVFDVERETRLWTMSGPPMVGGHTFASPDGGLALLDGVDACVTRDYDHVGCPVVPSRVVHLLRPAERQILRTLTFPSGRRPLVFIDNARFLLGGQALSVVDARKYTVVENLNSGPYYRSVAYALGSRRIYLGDTEKNELLVLEPEGPECSPPQSGLRILYSADGVLDDAVGLTKLEPHGNVAFRPGKVGQAFLMEGDGFLESPWTGGYAFGEQDATLALYVQFADIQGERILVSRMSKDGTAGLRVLKSLENRLVFLMALPSGTQHRLESRTTVQTGVWYHVVVTKDEKQTSLYVNGVREDTRAFQAEHPAAEVPETPLYLGSGGGEESALNGLIDEVMFYNRALSAQEVKALFQMRETGPCRP